PDNLVWKLLESIQIPKQRTIPARIRLFCVIRVPPVLGPTDKKAHRRLMMLDEVMEDSNHLVMHLQEFATAAWRPRLFHLAYGVGTICGEFRKEKCRLLTAWQRQSLARKVHRRVMIKVWMSKHVQYMRIRDLRHGTVPPPPR